MAQELGKVNMSLKLSFFAQKKFFLNFSFWRNPVLSKNLLSRSKNQPIVVEILII